MTYQTYLLLVLAFVAGMAGSVHAARPMIVDDARIVDPKSCQLESWMKKNPTSIEYWALPSCNFTGNLELTFGSALGKDPEGRPATQIILQGKTLFRPMQINGWGTGLAAGTVQNSSINANRNQTGDLYAYIPTSFSFRDHRFVLHTNLGWLYRMKEGEHTLTWGLGSETQLATRTWLVAETFGQNQGNPFFHVGFRHWIVANRVQVDTTYGNRIEGGSEERWFSIGLRLLSPAFLP